MIAGIDKLATKKTSGPNASVASPSKTSPAPEETANKNLAAEEIQKQLHTKPGNIRSYNFKKVKQGDQGLSKNTENILKRFGVDGNNKYHSGVLSDDGKTLVVVSSGKTSLSQLFGGSNSVSRFFYKVFGGIGRLFGAPHKALASNKYNELYNASHEKNPDGFKGEPIKHLLTALSKDQYHSISVFHKDDKTGDFDKQPVALAITDAYYNLFDTFMPLDKVPKEEIENYKNKYKKYYSIDKLIPLSKNPAEFKDIFHQVVEGLYQSQGFDLLAVPMHMHSNLNVNSNDLNYMELPWHKVLQTNSGSWKIVGDKKIIDEDESIKSLMDEKAREEYKSSLINQASQITFVRPKSEAGNPIPDILAHCDAWSQMSSGSQIRADKEEDRKLIAKVKMVDSVLINNHNTEQKIANKITNEAKDTKAETPSNKAGLLKKFFSKKQDTTPSNKA